MNCERINLVTSCDTDENVLNQRLAFAKDFAPAAYMDYHELLSDKNIDVIVIGTDSGKHFSIAMDALNAGKHVIVEEPMAMNENECRQMIQAAEKNKLKLGVCHQNRFNPSVQAVKRAVDEGF